MDNLLKQAHAILRLGWEVEDIVSTVYALTGLEKCYRWQIGNKSILVVEYEMKEWRDILPAKGKYFKLSHYIASLKQLVLETTGIAHSLNQMASSKTLETIETFTLKAGSEVGPTSSRYGYFVEDFLFRDMVARLLYKKESPPGFVANSVCVAANRFALKYPMFEASFRRFILGISPPLDFKAETRIKDFQERMDKIELPKQSDVVRGIRDECAQVIAMLLLEASPIQSKHFLSPACNRILDALKNAASPQKYDAITHDAGVSRSTAAEGLKTLRKLGLAKTLPGGGTIYVGEVKNDTGKTSPEKDS